ncbi:MAG: hypothetical protein KAH97_02280 [Anaerolineales bacterium]|nr:hypothetical protein [Anaerolineales bacterium]
MSLHDLYRDYQDQVKFLMIYIREAHPRDGWWLGGGLPGLGLKLSGSKVSTDIYDPKTMDERRDVASQCVTALEYEIPTLVDDIEDSVNQAYAGLPTRLYLVDLDGVVAYAGGLGPYGFKPGELKAAMELLLAVERV